MNRVFHMERKVDVMYNGRMTKKEKIIDGLRNIVIDRYMSEGKVLTPDDGNNIWYSLLDLYVVGVNNFNLTIFFFSLKQLKGN